MSSRHQNHKNILVLLCLSVLILFLIWPISSPLTTVLHVSVKFLQSTVYDSPQTRKIQAQQFPHLFTKPQLPGPLAQKVIIFSMPDSNLQVLGSLLNMSSDVFYMDEPLSGLLLSFKGSSETNFNLVDGFHDIASNFAFQRRFHGRIIQQLLNCTLQEDDLEDLLVIQQFLSKENSSFWLVHCLLGASDQEKKKECLKTYRDSCMKAHTRVVSVSTVYLSTITTVMEEDSDVRLIFMDRDPRAVTQNMRDRKKHLKRYGYRPQKMCMKALDLLRTLTDMAVTSMDRILLIRYEDIVLDPQSAISQLHEFVGLQKVDENQLDGYVNFLRSCPKPFFWREKIALDALYEIDFQCRLHYRIFGYIGTYKNFTLFGDESFLPIREAYSYLLPIRKVMVKIPQNPVYEDVGEFIVNQDIILPIDSKV